MESLENAHDSTQKQIFQLRKQLPARRSNPLNAHSLDGTSTTGAEAADSAQDDLTQSDVTPILTPREPPIDPASPREEANDVVESLLQANKELAARIGELRGEHNAMSDRLDFETRRAEAAVQALRAAEEFIQELQENAAIHHHQQQQHHHHQREQEHTQAPRLDGHVPVLMPAHLADRFEQLGGPTAILQALSERTMLLAEMDDENHRLREEIVLLEARCVTTETRLHHSVEEGVATSILLERGIGRLKAKSVADSDGAETRKTLTQAAMTLRRALEREGYDLTSLPLAPDPSLDLPYLRQILSDHADMCAAHFHKGAVGGVVPSATRKPLIYA
jgi:hypothetical protein